MTRPRPRPGWTVDPIRAVEIQREARAAAEALARKYSEPAVLERPGSDHRGRKLSGVLARFSKAWAALSAGVAVVVASGLLTRDVEVIVSTAVAAITATVAVATAPRNADPGP